MRSVFTILSTSGLAAAHGLVDYYVVDGTKYPAFDGRVDADFKPAVKRISYGTKAGSNWIGDVKSADIACRTGPLIEPAIKAVARAGSTLDIKWTDWFGNHKGPVLTFMGMLPSANTKVQDVNFFKIDDAGYDPKTMTYGSDWLIKNNNTQTVTIPSDIKPGTYVVRHEIIALHNSWQEDKVKQTSGAQHYPNCFQVEVTGSGTATPAGQKFPGTYHWNDPGILVNIYYGPNQYISPGGPLYKSTGPAGPQGPAPVVKETGELSGEVAIRYQAERIAKNKGLMTAVHQTAAMPGGGGCHWEVGADPSTMKCVATNKGDPSEPLWVGFAQPVGSPLYVEKPGQYMRRPPPPTSFETYKEVKAAVKFRS